MIKAVDTSDAKSATLAKKEAIALIRDKSTTKVKKGVKSVKKGIMGVVKDLTGDVNDATKKGKTMYSASKMMGM